MTRLETGLLIIALALVGAARVLVVTARHVRAMVSRIVRLARNGAAWMRSWMRAVSQARANRAIEVRARALREQNQEVVTRFTNKPRFPHL